MANYTFNIAKKQILDGTIDVVADDIRLVIVGFGSSMTTGNKEDADTVGGITGFSEFAGAGYTSGGKALTTKAVSVDDTNDLGKYTADNVNWTSVSEDAAGDAEGLMLIKFITNLSSSIPIAFYDTADFNAGGGDIDVTWPAGGVLQLT